MIVARNQRFEVALKDPKTKKHRVNPAVGDVFAIPLPSLGWAYGQLLAIRGTFTWFGFYARAEKQVTPPKDLMGTPYLVTLNCGARGVETGRWPVLFSAPVPEEYRAVPYFKHQDLLDREKFFLVSIDAHGREIRRPASESEVRGLRAAGSWSYGGAASIVEKLIKGEPVVL